MRPLTMIAAAALISLASVGCRQGDVPKDKIYDIKGKVVSVDVANKSVKLDHENIPGLMGAMEMSFDVSDAKQIEGLKAGDKVQGKLKVDSEGKRVITQLEKKADSSSLRHDDHVLLCCHDCENDALADEQPDPAKDEKEKLYLLKGKVVAVAPEKNAR